MNAQNSSNTIVNLTPSLIFPNPDQPRKAFDAAALGELAQSIQEHGLIQPLVVVELSEADAAAKRERLAPELRALVDRNARHMIVAGERRWRACMMLAKEGELETIAVMPKPIDHDAVLEIATAENVNRQDMNPMEEADAFHRVNVENRKTVKDIAKMFGKSEGYIRDRISLRNLTEELQNMVKGGHLPITLAIAVSRLEPGNQHRVVKIVNEEGLNAMEAVYLADRIFQEQAQGTMFDLEEYMRERAAEMATKFLEKMDAAKAQTEKVKEALRQVVNQLTLDDLRGHIQEASQRLAEMLMPPAPVLVGASDQDEPNIIPCGQIISPRCDDCPWRTLFVGAAQPVCGWAVMHPDADMVAEAATCPKPLPTKAELVEHEEQKRQDYMAVPEGFNPKTDMKVWWATPDILIRAARLPVNKDTAAKAGLDPVQEKDSMLQVTLERGQGRVVACIFVSHTKDGKTDLDVDLDFGGANKAQPGGLWHNTTCTLQAGHVVYTFTPEMGEDMTVQYREEQAAEEAAES